MTESPTLHLIVGLPGVGKTTLARKIAHEVNAVRFTPDEWMIPLFGTTWREPDFGGKRDVLEGRLLWAAHEVLGIGGCVVLDFGCWAESERWAVRAVAEHAGGRFRLHFVDVPEAERRARATARWEGGAWLHLRDESRRSRSFPGHLPSPHGSRDCCQTPACAAHGS